MGMKIPPLPRVRLFPDNATTGRVRLRLGDVILLNPCAWHTAPAMEGDREMDLLQPTYAPGSSRYFEHKIQFDHRRDHCKTDLAVGDPLSLGSPCFPQAFPEAARPVKGQSVVLARTKESWTDGPTEQATL